MDVTNSCGDALNPTASVPVQAGDTVYADGDTYHVRTVTSTGLVRFEERNDMGKAEFTAHLLDAAVVNVTRDIPTVQEVSEARYHREVRAFQVERPSMAAFLTIPVEADTYFLTETGGAGFALDGDSLVGLFNHTDDSGTGHALVGEAIRRGADELMCFDTGLTDLYFSWGFRETSRAEWDEDLAPEDWDYEQFGRPDVVWMAL